MTSLSHHQARELIQQGYLVEEDTLALRQHLASCADCRSYAATHIQLSQQLHMAYSRSRPTASQRKAILDAAERRSPLFWRPLATAGSLAAILFLATALWVVLSAVSPMTAGQELPAPLATLLAPFLPEPAVTSETPEPAPVLVPAPTATSSGTPDPRGRIVIDTVPAPSLAGNLVGEPLEQQVTVYLPPSYDGSDRRYPVVYAFLTPNREGDYIRSAMNLALHNGAPEMIVVSPPPINVLNLSTFYIDSEVFGDWEAFIAEDLIPYVDANYRTIPMAGSRGLFAMYTRSLGGLAIASRFPGLIGSLYLSYPNIVMPGSMADVHSIFMSDLARPRIIEYIAEAREWPDDTTVSSLQEAFAPPLHTKTQAFIDTVTYGMTFVPAIESGAPYFEYPYAAADSPPNPDIMQRWENGMVDILAQVWPRAASLREMDIMIVTDESASNSNYISESLSAASVDHSLVARSRDLSIAELADFGEEALGQFFAQSLSFE